MRRVWAGTICACLLLAASAYGQDESAIRDLVQKYVDARNNRDAEATRALFTPDADQLVSSGEWRKGLDALIRGAMASSAKEAGNSSITVQAVRFLTPDIAIVDGRYETSNRKMWSTLIVKRASGGWRIAAIRNMLPAPVGGSHTADGNVGKSP